MKISKIEYKGNPVTIIDRGTYKNASIAFIDNKTNSTFRFTTDEELYIKLDKKIEQNKTFKRIDLTSRIAKFENKTIERMCK
jgi:hypothetical protein